MTCYILVDSPVVEHDVRQPDLVGRHVQSLHPAVLSGVPHQLVVVPLLATQTHVLYSDCEYKTHARTLAYIDTYTVNKDYYSP